MMDLLACPHLCGASCASPKAAYTSPGLLLGSGKPVSASKATEPSSPATASTGLRLLPEKAAHVKPAPATDCRSLQELLMCDLALRFERA